MMGKIVGFHQLTDVEKQIIGGFKFMHVKNDSLISQNGKYIVLV